jgi:hypothetical protein
LCYLGLAQYQLKDPKDKTRATLQRALAMNLQSDLANEANRVLAQLK